MTENLNMRNMKTQLAVAVVAIISIFLVAVESKTLDPYRVLGVDRNADQKEIKKAFHKLSLQYHPDKNKDKDAREKFVEITNAYDILSDEDKRRKYDLYGDEKGAAGFDTDSAGNHDGYTYFTGDGPGQSGFSFRPEWPNRGRQDGGSGSFSFSSFPQGSSRSSFAFDLHDIFSSFFASDQTGWNSGRSQSSGTRSPPKRIRLVNADVYRKEIADKGITWLLLFHSSTTREVVYIDSVIREASDPLQGVLKAGSINCETEASLCKELGVYPRLAPRIFVYTYRSSESGSLVEYNGDLKAKPLENFCREHLPRFSKRINLGHFDFDSVTVGDLPKVLLLSTKKHTPVIWRALSGLYHKRFVLYDAEVHDVSDPAVRRLGVNVLPAIVGWLSDGEKHTIRDGISVKDSKSAIQDLSNALNRFEELNKKVASRQSKKMESESRDRRIPLLAGSNFDDICGEKTPVCIIGALRSLKARDKMEKILLSVSQKSMSRRQNVASGLRDTVSYALLDASKQQSFLSAFDKTGFKSLDRFILAYKRRKGKFSTFSGEITEEEVEKFVGSVLNGDVEFTKTRQKPKVKQ